MRLINTETGRFEEFFNLETTPTYAILSHTWDQPPKREQSYQEVVKIQEKFGHSVRDPPTSVFVPEAYDVLFKSTLNEEVLSDAPSSSILTSQPESRALNTPEPEMTTQHALSTFHASHLSLLMLVFLKSLFISILARVSLCLRGSPISPHPEDRRGVQTPSPPSPRRSIWDPDSGLSEKVRKACEIARHDGFQYIWVDSSCIDKTSSSELSEAINSMFNWYRDAQVCYAFLADVPSDDDVEAKESKFRESRWFQRAWTLQELIAPRVVAFLSREWEPLGTKDSLAELIQEITRIDCDILTHEKAMAEESVGERMRWAAGRQATRVEDEAYSLLGIFGITMPTLYGEGAYAFRRLQEEILQRIPDQSLFAWGEDCKPLPTGASQIMVRVGKSDEQSLFAPSPHAFGFRGGKIIPATQDQLESLNLPLEEYTPTPHGIRTQLLLLSLHALNPDLTLGGFLGSVKTWYLVILGCQQVDDQGRGHAQTQLPEQLLSRLCYITSPLQSNVEHLCLPCDALFPGTIFLIARSDLRNASRDVVLQTRSVYLPHLKTSMPELPPGRRAPANPGGIPSLPQLKLSLSSWTQATLRPHGYTVSDFCPIEHGSNSYSLTLFRASFDIHIQYRQMIIGQGYRMIHVIEARLWTLSPSDEDARNATVQHTPPYSSAIWVDWFPWSKMTPSLRSVHLVAPSNDEATLQLGFGLVTLSHFIAHVRLVTNGARIPTFDLSTRVSTRAPLEDINSLHMYTTHTGFKLTMLGSARKALEAQGYTVHLERPSCPAPNTDSSHCCTLTISNAASGFTIFIKYFHMLRNSEALSIPGSSGQGVHQKLIVAARVVLEPSSVQNTNDGPYVVGWADEHAGHMKGWRWRQRLEEIDLTTPDGHSVTLRLGMDLAWESEYYLVVDIGDSGSRSGQGHSPNLLLNIPHDCITLTLPAHIKRALQLGGYEVHFKRPGEDASDPYHLILSDANLTVDIECSHHLFMDSDGQQGLTFRACITTSSLHSTHRTLQFNPVVGSRTGTHGDRGCELGGAVLVKREAGIGTWSKKTSHSHSQPAPS